MSRAISTLLREVADMVHFVAAPRHLLTHNLSSVAVWEPDSAPADLTAVALAGIGVKPEDATSLIDAAARRSCRFLLLRDPGAGACREEVVEHAETNDVVLGLLRRGRPWQALLSALSTTVEEDGDAAVPRRTAGTTELDTSSGLPRGDLFALADALAELVGGPTIIEDSQFRVLSYSSFTGDMDEGRNTAILGRRIPPEWLQHLDRTGSLERLRTTSEVVDLGTGPGKAHRRLITSIRTRSQLLGFIWAAEGDTLLPAHAPSSMRDAAQIAVPHLLLHHEERRSERRRRGGLVRSLLSGQGSLNRQADELGLSRQGLFAVLAFAPVGTLLPDGGTTEEQWERLADHVALSCEALRWDAVTSRIGRTVFAILAVPEDYTIDGIRRLGRETVSRSGSGLTAQLCGVASTVGPRLGELNIRRKQAEDALVAVRRNPAPQFVLYEDVQPQVVLSELNQFIVERKDLTLPGLTKLGAEDDRRGSDYLRSVKVFLKAGASYRDAAEQLGLHVTSLRYRIKRATEISGLDFTHPEVRLVCQLLLHAHD